MEKGNSQLEHRQPMEQTRGLFCMCYSGVARCQYTTPESQLANDIDVRSELHGQVSLAAVNQILCVVHEAMKGCKILKIHLRLALKM